MCILQMLYKFCRIPQEDSFWGLQITEKEGKSWGLEPFLEPVEGWGVSRPIWAAPPLHLCKTYHKPASFACWKSQQTLKNLLEKLVQKNTNLQ